MRPHSAVVARDTLPTASGTKVLKQAIHDVRNVENHSPQKQQAGSMTPRYNGAPASPNARPFSAGMVTPRSLPTPRLGTPRLGTPRGRPPLAALNGEGAGGAVTSRAVSLPFSADVCLSLKAKLGSRDWAPLDAGAFKQMVRDLPVSPGEVSDEALHGVVRSLADEAGQVNMRALARALDAR